MQNSPREERKKFITKQQRYLKESGKIDKFRAEFRDDVKLSDDFVTIAYLSQKIDGIKMDYDQMLAGKGDYQKKTISILNNVKKNILDNTGYYELRIYSHDAQYRNFAYHRTDGYPNLFELPREKYDKQFQDVKEASETEKEYVTLFWTAKASKEFEGMEERIGERVMRLGQTLPERKKNIKSFNNRLCSRELEEGYSLRDNFIDDYNNYAFGDYDEEELKQMPSYKETERIFRREYCKTGRFNEHASMEDMYMMLSMEKSEEALYDVKSKYTESLTEKAISGKDKNLQVRKNIDKNTGRFDDSAKGTVLVFAHKGYSNIVMVHANSQNVKSIESRNNRKIELGDNASYQKYFMTKPTREEIKGLNIMKANERATDYPTTSRDIDFMYAMQNNPANAYKSIKMPDRNSRPKQDELEI